MSQREEPNPYAPPTRSTVPAGQLVDGSGPPLEGFIRIRGTLLREEFEELWRLTSPPAHVWPKPLADQLRLLLFFAAVIGLLLLLPYGMWCVGGLALVVSLLVGAVLFSLWSRKSTINQMWGSGHWGEEEFERTMFEDRVESTSPTTAMSYQWVGFTKYQLSETMLVAIHKHGIAFTFPRRIFASEADWQTFLQLIQRKMPAGKPVP